MDILWHSGLDPQTLLWIDANEANRSESVPVNLNYLENVRREVSIFLTDFRTCTLVSRNV